MTKEEYEHILKLAPYLGGLVITPMSRIMELVGIYSNGNVLCVGETPPEYASTVKEFHALSVTPKELPKFEKENKKCARLVL
ncbi:hypothetical protein LCGC14_1974320 [marine sediment metagenome]|uniref:Uncharacterized protein n=1 Tax=marine sediment metagenome TaxID=412755 RepID=A0A0F9HP76_9ZZZZ